MKARGGILHGCNGKMSCVLVLLAVLGMIFAGPGLVAAGKAGGKGGDGGAYIQSEQDWTVTGVEEHDNEVLVLGGDLAILNNARLAFVNVTLVMDSNDSVMHHITIQTGGVFEMQASMIKANGSSQYDFVAYGRLTMVSSVIKGLYWSPATLTGGLQIRSSSSSIMQSTVSQLSIIGSSPTVLNTTITGTTAINLYACGASAPFLSDIYFNKATTYSCVTGGVLTLRRYIHVRVLDMNENPVLGATVKVKSGSATIFTGNTGPDGFVRGISVPEYTIQGSVATYVPHTVTVTKKGMPNLQVFEGYEATGMLSVRSSASLANRPAILVLDADQTTYWAAPTGVQTYNLKVDIGGVAVFSSYWMQFDAAYPLGVDYVVYSRAPNGTIYNAAVSRPTGQVTDAVFGAYSSLPNALMVNVEAVFNHDQVMQYPPKVDEVSLVYGLSTNMSMMASGGLARNPVTNVTVPATGTVLATVEFDNTVHAVGNFDIDGVMSRDLLSGTAHRDFVGWNVPENATPYEVQIGNETVTRYYGATTKYATTVVLASTAYNISGTFHDDSQGGLVGKFLKDGSWWDIGVKGEGYGLDGTVGSDPAPPTPDDPLLGVPIRNQMDLFTLYGNWDASQRGCGVTSTGMIFSYYTGQFANLINIWNTWGTNPSMGQMRDWLNAHVATHVFVLASPRGNRDAVIGTLENHINAGRPMIMVTNTWPGGGNHAIVVKGYTHYNEIFFYNDPGLGIFPWHIDGALITAGYWNRFIFRLCDGWYWWWGWHSFKIYFPLATAIYNFDEDSRRWTVGDNMNDGVLIVV